MNDARPLLEKKLLRLELHSGDSMSEAVAGYYRRVSIGNSEVSKMDATELPLR